MRKATPADADRLSELDIELFPDNCFNERTMRIEIELGDAWVIGNPVLGFILTRRDGDITDITRLGISTPYQGRGVGQLLLTEALYQTPGPHYLMVRKNNEKAIRLYKQNGFSIVATTPKSWIMLRPITLEQT